MKILITICARGGSKGIPGKNIKLLNGNPLIYYTIMVSRQFAKVISNVDIILSTDSSEILKIAEDLGLRSSYVRPEYLAGDDVGKVETIKDVLFWKEKTDNIIYDYILDLDVTSPLRNIHDLTDAFEIVKNKEEAFNLFSVSPAHRSPYFNMVEQNQNGYYSLVKKTDKPFLTRQSAPEVYDMNASFYFYRRSFFDADYKSSITNKSLVYIVPHMCFDLDHPLDFEILSYLMANNKLDFTL